MAGSIEVNLCCFTCGEISSLRAFTRKATSQLQSGGTYVSEGETFPPGRFEFRANQLAKIENRAR